MNLNCIPKRNNSAIKNNTLGKYLIVHVIQIIYYKREIENSLSATDFVRNSWTTGKKNTTKMAYHYRHSDCKKESVLWQNWALKWKIVFEHVHVCMCMHMCMCVLEYSKCPVPTLSHLLILLCPHNASLKRQLIAILLHCKTQVLCLGLLPFYPWRNSLAAPIFFLLEEHR